MGREIHHDSILALEKQIEEHERAIIRLKRARNSLLNVSTLLPPEILGSIFHWNVIPDGDFGGLSKGSYNFLLVCHHWFEVASCTPELWCSWGNSIRDWTRRHTRCGTASLDLVLGEYTAEDHKLDDDLRDALQDRAARGIIRRVHLSGFNVAELLGSVVSSIVTNGEAPRSNCMESFILLNRGGSSIVDVSALFSRYHFPKLRRLWLDGCRISSWDLLKSQAMVLNILHLTSSGLLPTPSLSQLLSVLSSSPLLQILTLSQNTIPHVIDNDRSSPRVLLRHLKKLCLLGNLHHVFGLLNRLELPDKVDKLSLSLDECSPSDVSEILGPYLGDLVRRRGKFPGGGLGLVISLNSRGLHLSAGDVRGGHHFAGVVDFADVSVDMNLTLEDEEATRLGFDIIAQIPREQVVILHTSLPILLSQELCVEMCNLAYLRIDNVDLSTLFMEPIVREPYTPKDLLRSLDRITFTWPVLSDGDWGPFIDFLSHRAAAGNRISSLTLIYHPYMDEDVVESIEHVVGVFESVEGGEASEDEYSADIFEDGYSDDAFVDEDNDEVPEDGENDEFSGGDDSSEVFEDGDSDEGEGSDY